MYNKTVVYIYNKNKQKTENKYFLIVIITVLLGNLKKFIMNYLPFEKSYS